MLFQLRRVSSGIGKYLLELPVIGLIELDAKEAGRFRSDPDGFCAQKLNIDRDRFVCWKKFKSDPVCMWMTPKHLPCWHPSLFPDVAPKDFVPGVTDRCELHYNDPSAPRFELLTPKLDAQMHTPWGKARRWEPLAPGVFLVSAEDWSGMGVHESFATKHLTKGAIAKGYRYRKRYLYYVPHRALWVMEKSPDLQKALRARLRFPLHPLQASPSVPKWNTGVNHDSIKRPWFFGFEAGMRIGFEQFSKCCDTPQV
jgi:hypothetical protein